MKAEQRLEDYLEDWNDAATSEGMLSATRNEEARHTSPLQLQKEWGPADTLISAQ